MEKFAKIPRGKRILVASDFDGTLAPIVARASEARILPAARDALIHLAGVPRVDIAIVSGRSLLELGHLCENLPARWMAAGHGATVLRPDGSCIDLSGATSAAEGISNLESEVVNLVEAHPGMALERKDTGMALHYRNVPTEELPLALRAIDGWSKASRLAGFEVLHGRFVVEIVPPGASKLKAIQAITKELLPDFVIFAGDDTTDLESVKNFSESTTGLGVWIRSAERPSPPFQPDLALDGPADWARFIDSLAEHLEEAP
ncbi:MAG TPA: trehalose-phosphatase [Fibrobacteria bacterium]|nr:trehalose-phosphatase [Fibrobacteria bacterium]HOX51534.1 trehalose-phosphatase [Fibrobacteria bacterium]